MEADLRIFDEVDSTNITLEELAADGAEEGCCVISFRQRSGEGRSGRSFYSPKGGNLYMSLLLRPQDERTFGLITVMAAASAVNAIKTVLGADAGIKWVNDIICNGKKAGGIIAKAGDFGTDNMHVILGIGLNIYEAETVPEDIRQVYGSIMGRACTLRDDEARAQAVRLAEEIIKEFSRYYEDPGADAVGDYRKSCAVIGKDVEYISGSEVITGQVIGIDDDGGIIIRTGDTQKAYRDGEIRIKVKNMQSCTFTAQSL